MEEERRLCYVGVTRARKKLYMTYARQRLLYNQFQHNAPSRFLKEMPKRVFEKVRKQRQSATLRNASTAGMNRPNMGMCQDYAQRGAATLVNRGTPVPGIPGVQKGFGGNSASTAATTDFQQGDRIMHKRFGRGTVVLCQGSGVHGRITIDFEQYGTKTFALSIAPIEKIEE